MSLTKLIFDIVLYFFIARLWLQFYHAPYNNTISQFVIRFTSPLVRPLQRVLPGWKGIDFAIILSFLIIAFLKYALILWLDVGHLPLATTIAMSCIDFMEKNIEFFFFLILTRAIISWFAPASDAPATQLLILITEPIMIFARKYIPPIGGVDYSPILLLIILRILDFWLIEYLIAVTHELL